jgi:hypothetical protein
VSNWKSKLAHLIAGKELAAEQSRRNRIFKKMVWSYVATLWDQEMACDCEDAMNHLHQRLEEASK